MSYTEQDLQEAVDKVFEKYDKDRNGILNREEITDMMTASYKRIGRSKPSHAEVTQLFNLYDKNRDEEIQKNELKNILRKSLAGKMK